jgi:hypothetical protein
VALLPFVLAFLKPLLHTSAPEDPK